DPPRPAFVDDRFELFGRGAILEYIDALQGGPGWDVLRDRERIDLVWVRPDRGLAQRLAQDPRWRVLHRDPVSVLFKRADSDPDPVSVSSRPWPELKQAAARRDGEGDGVQ